MDTVEFYDYEDLAYSIYGYAKEEKKDVTVVTFYSSAVALLRELCIFDDLELYDITLSGHGFGDYDKEYYVSITPDMKLFIEHARNGERIVDNVADLILFDGDASSTLIKHNCGQKLEYEIYPECADEPCDISNRNQAQKGDFSNITRSISVYAGSAKKAISNLFNSIRCK